MMILMKFDEKYASCNDMYCYLVFTVELLQRAMLKKAKQFMVTQKRIKRAIGNIKQKIEKGNTYI